MHNTIPSRFRTFVAVCVFLVGTLVLANRQAMADDTFQQRRAELIAKYDTNGDGKLDAKEREQMRLTVKKENLEGKKGGRGGFQIPKEFLAKHDTDQDGEMSRPEWEAAEKIETKILMGIYDVDGDGKMDKDEKKAIMAAVADETISGIPAFYARGLAGQGRRGRRGGGTPEYLERSMRWLEFDVDGDGFASAEELEAIRAASTKEP